MQKGQEKRHVTNDTTQYADKRHVPQDTRTVTAAIFVPWAGGDANVRTPRCITSIQNTLRQLALNAHVACQHTWWRRFW